MLNVDELFGLEMENVLYVYEIYLDLIEVLIKMVPMEIIKKYSPISMVFNLTSLIFK